MLGIQLFEALQACLRLNQCRQRTWAKQKSGPRVARDGPQFLQDDGIRK